MLSDGSGRGGGATKPGEIPSQRGTGFTYLYLFLNKAKAECESAVLADEIKTVRKRLIAGVGSCLPMKSG
jgi:hypothetical protein